MNIEIWSDFVCPFCYIGKRRLEAALEQFPHREHVNVTYRSFELDPSAPTNDTRTVFEMLAKKYGMTIERAKQTSAQVADQAASVGLNFQFENMVATGTFDAHRLSHFAKEQGKEAAYTERVLKAYFEESAHIGQRDVLVQLATEIGLHEDDVRDVLESNRYAENVRADEQLGARLEIRGVPFFVFQNKYGISGAQSTEAFLDVLQRVWNEQNVEAEAAPTCTDDSCEI